MVTTELIADFVNTRELLPAVEALVAPEDLSAWLVAHGLLSPNARADAADLEEALAVREALRALLLANSGVEIDLAGPTAVLDGAARRARVELRLIDGSPALVAAAAGVSGALGQILAAMYALTVDGAWARMKACRARDCEWAFVDNAKNQSRAWCSMSSCGNREKARVFRERRRSVET